MFEKISASDLLRKVAQKAFGFFGESWLADWKAKQTVKGNLRLVEGFLEARKLINKELNETATNKETVKIKYGETIEAQIVHTKNTRLNNSLDVLNKTFEDLGDQKVPNQELDDDWIELFFRHVQDVSSEDLRKIWVRILADEIKIPNNTSRFTLNILKNMSQEDAKLFENIAKFVFSFHLLYVSYDSTNIANYPTPGDLVKLDSYGLLNNNDGSACHFPIPEGELFIDSHTMFFKITAPNKVKQIQIPSYPLTPQGKELYKAIGIDPNAECLQAMADWLHHKYRAKLEKANKEGTFQDETGATKNKHSKLITITPTDMTK